MKLNMSFRTCLGYAYSTGVLIRTATLLSNSHYFDASIRTRTSWSYTIAFVISFAVTSVSVCVGNYAKVC